MHLLNENHFIYVYIETARQTDRDVGINKLAV